MPNDLVVNLDAFKTERVPDAELPVDESLAGGIGTAYAIIGYRQGKWSLRYRGETHLFKRKDGTLADHIDVVILHAAPGKSKSYFENWEDGTGDPPLCASLDGVVPDVGVEQQQAEACGICPRNEWKTLPNGRKGRECTDYKRLAVALMPNATASMFGEPLLEPVFLRVPPASLNSLALLDQKMGAKGLGYHYSSYLTRISFVQVDGKGQPMSYPQMIFYAVRPLSAPELTPIKDMRKDPQCQRITGEAGGRGGVRAIAGPTSSNVDQEAFAVPPGQLYKMIGVTPNQTSPAVTGTLSVPPATILSEEEETGFASTSVKQPGVQTVSPSEPAPPAASTSAQTIVADTGEPEESDAELDRRIAGLINKVK